MRHANHLALVLVPLAFVIGCDGGSDSSEPTPDAGVGGSGGSGGSDAGVVAACSNIDALRATCQALPDRFDASTTLAKGCYLASKSPVIGAAVTLTIAPGTTILFAEGTGLDISGGQVLLAEGTAQEPICLSGDKAVRGSWQGLQFGHNETASKLDYVTIEYGGSTKSDAEAAAIKGTADSSGLTLSIKNTTVRESQGYGLYLVSSAQLAAFADNTLTKNTLGPASIDSDLAGLLDAGSSYSGNDVDEVWVRTNRVSKNATWKSLGVPFHLSGNLHVEVPWTIEAPNTLIGSAGSWVSVDGDAAALTAVGASDKPIVFTGEKKERGFWNGLIFNGSKNAANKLDFVTVEYAGSTASDAANAGVKAIADSHGLTLSVTNTTLQENQGYGLYLTGSAELPAFANNTFTKNTLGPVNVGSEAVHQLDTTSKYTGNELDRVRVRDGYVSNAVTWQDLGVPYQTESNLHVAKVWTLAPGVTLMMAKDTWISTAGDEAGFHVVGTAQKPITITGIEKTSGYWHALVFDNSNNGANVLEYATIEYGGSLQGGGETGMITAQSDSHGVTISVKSCTIQGSAQWGIVVGQYTQYNADIESANTFNNNAGGNFYKP